MSQPTLNMPGSDDAVALEAMRDRLQGRRRVKNAIALTLSLAAMAFGLIWLVWILLYDACAWASVACRSSCSRNRRRRRTPMAVVSLTPSSAA